MHAWQVMTWRRDDIVMKPTVPSLPVLPTLLVLAVQLLLTTSLPARGPVAMTPPLGFNSYDSYDWTMNETQLFASAVALQQRLLPFGYNTITLDWYWYRDGRQITRTLPRVGMPTNSSCQIFFDKAGRMYPDPHRFPSTRDCRCWAPITTRLRAMGISLGLHLMPGVTAFAVDAGFTVPGTSIRLSDIVDYTRRSHGGAICPGCNFYQLNMTRPGAQAWYDAYYAQLASWGVKFIKADFLPAETDADNIRGMAAAITKSKGDIALSIHGVSSPAAAKAIGKNVNMYRITSDVHDSWGAVRSGFAASSEYARQGLIGAPGLNGRSWPNHDMLPLGLQKPPNGSPYPRPNGLSLDEQRTLMTLWAITRSPLIYGGRLDNMSQQTVSLLTHPAILALSQNATQPPTPVVQSTSIASSDRVPNDSQRSWVAGSEVRVGMTYQGLGYGLVKCNKSDMRQRWNASLLSPLSSNGRHGERASAVNIHKTYVKNGTGAQQVCMRLMVYNHNCENSNWTKMDLMDCSVSHCNGSSIRWVLPGSALALGEDGGKDYGQGQIMSELTQHCLTADAKRHVAVAPCISPMSTAVPGQEWRVTAAVGPDAGLDEVSIVEVSSGQCLTETTPIPPSAIATIWMNRVRVERGELIYVGLFNIEDSKTTITVTMASLGLAGRKCDVHEVWSGMSVPQTGPQLDVVVAAHGISLLEFECRNIE